MKKHKLTAFMLLFLIFLSSCTLKPEITTNEPTTLNDETQTSEITPQNTDETSEHSKDTSQTEPAPTVIPQTTEHISETKEKTSKEETEQNIQVDSPTSKTDEKEGKTFTGRKPLPLGNFSSFDPKNTKNLPTKKIEHSYGVASGGKPHSISIDNQKFFDKKGYNALALDTKTKEKILYLTFDCGYENGNTAKILDSLKTKGVKAAFFCTLPQMRENPDLIARMINEGHIVGNHSNRHPSFAEIDRTRMAKELQEFDDYLRTNFGYTAPVFRFPKGEYSESALDLVESLGYKSVFWSVAYSDWDTNNQKGKAYALKTVTERLHPGAVILLHAVSSDNAAAIGDIIDWAKGQNYEFRELL